MKTSKLLYLIITLLLTAVLYKAQVELVPPSNPVYNYLKRMHLKGILVDYNSANLPYGRSHVSDFLRTISENPNILSFTDKKILEDYLIEFSYEDNKNLGKTFSLIPEFKFNKIFENKTQKYLYNFSDENASMFIDGIFNYRFRTFNGDSLGNHSLQLADLGLRIRGTLYKTVGYYLHLYSGQQISGEKEDRIIAANLDPYLGTTENFIRQKYYNSFTGYLRYEAEKKWIAITIGREEMSMGTGYIDKMVISNNTVPFDFARIDLNYKAIQYSFFYGNIRGDSLDARQLQTKNFINHRIDVRFADWIKVGFFESIIASEFPFNFTYFNPVSFLTLADFTVEAKNEQNATMGIDVELNLFKNLGLQGTWFVDDIDFRDLGGDTKKSNDNKFAYQAGLLWTDAFTLPNLEFALEYTRIEPFVYSHRTNKSTYTHYGYSLGHALPPNSDEIAAKIIYYFTNRIRFDFLYQRQRSGEGVVLDEDGNLESNYGGYINWGEGDFLQINHFLQGNRIDRDIFTFDFYYEPINQYYIKLKYVYSIIDRITDNRKMNDNYFYLTLGIDF